MLAAEVVLRVASAYVPAIDLRTRRPGFEYVPDSILVWQGRSGYPGRDARGYRNPMALDHADMVVLGDSQTEGVSVPQSDIWSSVAGDNLGVTTYNMGIEAAGAPRGRRSCSGTRLPWIPRSSGLCALPRE